MTDRNSDTAIRAMIEHGLRPDSDCNEAALAENARALMEENDRLRANLDEAAKAHAADHEDIGKAKAALRRICRMVGGQCTDDVSLAFLLHVPDEVEVFRAELAAARARIAALEAALTWRPIAEAPKVACEPLIVWLPADDQYVGNPPKFTNAEWDEHSSCWLDDESHEVHPTHYMPAPEPPKEAQPK